MPNNKQPPPEVILAYARKAQRLSQEIEKMARIGSRWLDKSVVSEMWHAQIALYHVAATLKEKSEL